MSSSVKLDIFSFIVDLSQLWKLDGRTLKNKAELSKDEWTIIPNGTSIIITNFSNNKYLTTTDEGEVIEDDRKNIIRMGRVQPGFLWKKGKPDTEGYFTLKNAQTPKFLTVTSESTLEIKGTYNFEQFLDPLDRDSSIFQALIQVLPPKVLIIFLLFTHRY